MSDRTTKVSHYKLRYTESFSKNLLRQTILLDRSCQAFSEVFFIFVMGFFFEEIFHLAKKAEFSLNGGWGVLVLVLFICTPKVTFI